MDIYLINQSSNVQAILYHSHCLYALFAHITAVIGDLVWKRPQVLFWWPAWSAVAVLGAMLIDFLFVHFLLILFKVNLKGRSKDVKAELLSFGTGPPQEGFVPVAFSTIGLNKGHMNHSRQCDCHGVTVNLHHWLDDRDVIPTGSNRPQLSFFLWLPHILWWGKLDFFSTLSNKSQPSQRL